MANKTFNDVKLKVEHVDLSSDTARSVLVSNENVSTSLGKIARWYKDIVWKQDKATNEKFGIVKISNDYNDIATDTVPTSKALNDVVQLIEESSGGVGITYREGEGIYFSTDRETYKGLEYIESDGVNKVIDTRITPIDGLQMHIQFSLLEPLSLAYVSGVNNSSNEGFSVGTSNGSTLDVNEHITSPDVNIESGKLLEILVNIDDSMILDESIPLFARRMNDTYDGFAKMRLYSAYIVDGEDVYVGLIPVEKVSDGTVGLLNLKNSKFYENIIEDGGAFIAGPYTEELYPESPAVYDIINLKTASKTQLGGIKVGDGLSIKDNGELYVSTEGATYSFYGNEVTTDPSLTNGMFKVVEHGKNGDTPTYVKIKGLGSAAYTDSDAYANASHSHTKSEITDFSHTHSESDITNLGNYAGSSTKGGSATSAVKLDTNTAGNQYTPVYFNEGKPVSIAYTINASVPTGALFTDEKVKQSPVTTDDSYEVLFAGSTGNTVKTEGVGKATTLTFNPKTGALSASSFSGDLSASDLKSGTINSGRLPDTTIVTGNYGPASGGTLSHGGTFDVPYITVDRYGRLTASATKTFTLPTQYTHPSHTAATSGLYKITVDALGHVSATTAVAKTDITALGIPASDTHYTTGLKVGASSTATANAAATNGNVYLNVLDNTTVRDSHKIVGSGATTVTSDANGVITISSTDNNTTYSSKSAVSGGTDVSLVTTGEKYTWNSKTSNTGTVTSVTVKMNNADVGTVTTSGTINLGTVITSHQSLAGRAINGTLTNENLNNVTTPGVYNAGGGNTITNKPSGVEHFGLLVVHDASGSYYTQKLFTDTTQYTRKCVNGTWGSWSEDKLTDTVYTHPTSSGNRHIPSGGSSEQILRWSADGTATWGNAIKVDATAGSDNTSRHVWFSNSGDETKRVYDDDFKYNPYTNTLTVGTVSGSLSGNATSATRSTNSDNTYTTVTDPSSSTSYGVIFAVDPGTSEDNRMRKSNDFRLNHFRGAANTEGEAGLVLGNNTLKTASGNSTGSIGFYNSKGVFSKLVPNTGSSSVTLTLPSSTGTLALVGDNNHSHNYAGSSSAGGVATGVAGSVASTNVARHVWFSSDSPETTRVYDDDFKYNPSTNTLTVGTVSGRVTNSDACKVEVTSAINTTNYGVLFVANPGTSQDNTLRKNSNFKYAGIAGTTSTEGWDEIRLGNSTAAGTAGNSTGWMLLYGDKGYNVELGPASGMTADIDIRLPASSGTLELKGHTHNYAGSSSAGGAAITISQTETTTSSFRGIVTGGTASSTAGAGMTSSSQQVYISNMMFTQPSSGTIYGRNLSAFNKDGSDVIIEWNRNANASWRMLNTGGTLKLQCNYTTSKTSWFDVTTYTHNHNGIGIYDPVQITSTSFGTLKIYRNDGTNASCIGFYNNTTNSAQTTLGFIGMNAVNGSLIRWNANVSAQYTILDETNYSTWCAAKTHTHNYAGSASAGGVATGVAGAVASTNVARHVWFSSDSPETTRVYDDDFKYNPSTNTLTVGIINGEINTTVTYPSSLTSYGMLFAASPNTSGNNTLRKSNDIRVNHFRGAANTEGEAKIVLGNNTASTAAGNSTGQIGFYNSKGGYTLLYPNTQTSAITLTLPASTGTLALVGDNNHTHSYIPLSGSSSITGELSTSSANGFRLYNGGYGAFLRNDGTNLYILLTDKKTDGSEKSGNNWNSLRPFYLNLSTGSITMGCSVTMGKSATIYYSSFEALRIRRTGEAYGASIGFSNGATEKMLGYIGMTGDANGGLLRWKADTTVSYVVIDTGNKDNYTFKPSSHTHSYAAAASAGAGSTKVHVVVKTPPSSVSSSYILFATTTGADSDDVVQKHGNITYRTLAGSTSAEGWAEIALGNTTATGTDGNSTGWLMLYGDKGYNVELGPAVSMTKDIDIRLPVSGGSMTDIVYKASSYYLPCSGGTLTANVTLTESKSLILRTNASYLSGIGYDTQGNECVAIWAKNTVTRLRWHAGVDMSATTYTKMMSITPDFEVSKADGTAKGYIAGNRIDVQSKLWAGSTSCGARTSTTITFTTAITASKFRTVKVFWATSNSSGVSEFRADTLNILNNVMTASTGTDSNIVQFKIASDGKTMTVGPGTTAITVLVIIACDPV